MIKRMTGIVLASLSLSTAVAQAAETAGAGSTFVFPILEKWATAYEAKTGDKVSYQSIGSGAGINQIKAATVDFGASDMPLRPEELEKRGLGQFPLVVGGVVPIVNIDGVGPGVMRFSGAMLADIFLGKIRNWDDPAIRALNPDVNLPAAAISVIHRSDGSGTTFNWANYLSKVSPEWKDKVGEGTTVDWPTGAGGKGNEGVAAFVAVAKNSISYVEYAYAIKNKLAYGLVQNRAGRFVQPGAETFQAAAMNANWSGTKDFFLIMTDAPGENVYPVTATAFIIMYKQPKDFRRAKLARDFFRWSLENGQAQAEALSYVPLPPPLVRQIEDYWNSQFGG
ncbi:MAG: phosphate ABC transporter substrate-binding protein PstS [Rhizomicrobium sp.]